MKTTPTKLVVAAHQAASKLYAFSKTDEERRARALIVDALAEQVRDITGRMPTMSEAV